MSIDSAEASLVGPLGWRQGSILPLALVRQLKEAGELVIGDDEESHRFLVISQDCDVVHRSFGAGPWCEVLMLKSIPKKDGNFERGKSPRRLQFDLPGVGPVDCSIHDRHRFRREYLTLDAPDNTVQLNQDLLRLLRGWLARRYARTAFPDAFNKRWEPVQKNITSTFKGVGELFEEVFLLTEFEELSNEDEYHVTIVGAMLDDFYEDDQAYQRADDALAKVAKQLESCLGIKAENYVVRPRRDISLSELDHMRRWDYLDPISEPV